MDNIIQENFPRLKGLSVQNDKAPEFQHNGGNLTSDQGFPGKVACFYFPENL